MTAPSAADLASACAWLDARKEGILVDNAVGGQWGVYVSADVLKPDDDVIVGERTCAECIIATARALGWQPPEPTVSPEERARALRVAEAALAAEPLSCTPDMLREKPWDVRHAEWLAAIVDHVLGAGAR